MNKDDAYLALLEFQSVTGCRTAEQLREKVQAWKTKETENSKQSHPKMGMDDSWLADLCARHAGKHEPDEHEHHFNALGFARDIRDAVIEELRKKDHRHVGDSQFEGWYSQYAAKKESNPKQIARDAYAAGMGDPTLQPEEQSVDMISWDRIVGIGTELGMVWDDENGWAFLHDDMLNEYVKRIVFYVLKKYATYDLAHQIWSAAQVSPGEGIVDAVFRIRTILQRMGE